MWGSNRKQMPMSVTAFSHPRLDGRGKFRLTSNVDISALRVAQISVSNAFPVVDLVQKCT